MTVTLYNVRGNGGGAVNLRECVSRRESDSDLRLVCADSASGAKTVRYDFDCEDAFNAKGFVGRGEAWRFGRGIFVENGRSVERSDEIGVGALWAVGRLIYVDSSVSIARNRFNSLPSFSRLSVPDSISPVHFVKSATSFLSRFSSAASLRRDFSFSIAASDIPSSIWIASSRLSLSSGLGSRNLADFRGLPWMSSVARRFIRFSCLMLGLLLSSPLGRSGAFSRPSCVGVGGSSGSRGSSSNAPSKPVSRIGASSSSLVALPPSSWASCPSGVSASAGRVGIGDPKVKSDGLILFVDSLRGGFAKASIALARRLGEERIVVPPIDIRGAFNGLPGPKDGRIALRRNPLLSNSFPCPYSAPRLIDRRTGDLLSARSRTSGCDLARLDLVGD